MYYAGNINTSGNLPGFDVYLFLIVVVSHCIGYDTFDAVTFQRILTAVTRARDAGHFNIKLRYSRGYVYLHTLETKQNISDFPARRDVKGSIFGSKHGLILNTKNVVVWGIKYSGLFVKFLARNERQSNKDTKQVSHT